MTDLFRKEVVERQGQTHFGDVVLASPLSHKAVTALLAIIIAGLVTFSIVGEYSRKERVTGYLIPDRGLIRLVPRQVGVIETLYADVGDAVEKGDKLFSIQMDVVAGNGSTTAQSVLVQLGIEKSELIRRRDLIPQQYSLTRRRIEGQIKAAKSEAQRLDARIEFQARTVDNEQVVFETFKKLMVEEATSLLEASNQENRLLQASQALGALKNEKQRYLDQSKDLQAQYGLLPITEQREMSDVISQLSNLEQRITQTQGQERYVITAPVSGRLASVLAREGQTADVGRPVATILPQGGTLEAELLVPSRAAGFVKEGQTVRLLYDAFPFQKFGSYSGEISDVSRTVINANELPIRSNINEPVFIIKVRLNRQDIDANNDVYVLQSGMTLAADIILEDRKIWEWIFEPVLGAAKTQ